MQEEVPQRLGFTAQALLLCFCNLNLLCCGCGAFSAKQLPCSPALTHADRAPGFAGGAFGGCAAGPWRDSGRRANGVAPPDPYGSVQIFIGGAWQEQLEIDLSTQWQTINPSWRIGWDHVRLEENIRIQLKLTDNDDGWSADDYIGTVQLNYDDLVGAAEANQIYNVATHDQGQGTLLFVGISVVAESGSAQ